jgi:hypothetical protein
MIRKLASVLAALLCVAGFGLGTAGSAQAQSVIPHHGTYTGVDHHGRMVTLSFNGTEITHFQVAHLSFGNAHVSQGMWHERCNGGVCFKGAWVTDGHVAGFWKYGGDSSWTPWSATFTPPVTPYTGTYMGHDHTGLRVHLSYHSGHLRAFTLDHNLVGDAPVGHDRSFDVCHRVVCFKGHWEGEYTVVGSWRYVSGHEWHAWEAFAYAT